MRITDRTLANQAQRRDKLMKRNAEVKQDSRAAIESAAWACARARRVIAQSIDMHIQMNDAGRSAP
jgi:hypothetical protein